MKKLSLFIITVMLFTVLSGCSGNKETEVKPIPEKFTKENASGEESSKETAEEDSKTEENASAEENGSESDTEESISEERAAIENDIDDNDAESDMDADEDAGEKLYFETEDISGNRVSINDFKNAKVIMLNFWEPWCGPCVGEMPDLEAIYQKYKNEGFIILGSFMTEGADDDVNAVIAYTGVTYPVIKASDSMIPYMTEYVPTTVFLDGEGHVISTEPIIGSHSYNEWDEIIGDYLK